MSKKNRLSRNFHKSFKPERHYINYLLRYAAAGKAGDYQEIAKQTGIPMGSSSGKVPAIIDYCRGMGLIALAGKSSAIKQPVPTILGNIVLHEDPFLKAELTQWLCHLNLCRTTGGADVWHAAFFHGRDKLGMEFSRENLEMHLQNTLKTGSSGLTGPMVGMYEDDAAFAACAAVSEEKNIIRRKPAPVGEEYAYAYGAWLLQLAEDHFPKHNQISILDLNTEAGCRDIPGWNIDSFQQVLSLLETKGILSVDRHMQPWLIQAKISPSQALKSLYDDLI